MLVELARDPKAGNVNDKLKVCPYLPKQKELGAGGLILNKMGRGI